MKYSSSMQEYLTNNYAIEINNNNENEDLVGYLPHRPVMLPLKPNNVRVVFDCGAKYKGVSLNDSLMPGPCLTSNLVGVLTRFRKEQVALIGDIQVLKERRLKNDPSFEIYRIFKKISRNAVVLGCYRPHCSPPGSAIGAQFVLGITEA